MVRRNRLIDLIADQLLEAAKKLREDPQSILGDDRLTDDERTELKDALLPYAAELEERAEFWRTGRHPE